MKTEIIKYYSGDVLAPLGRPHLVLVGQEFDDTMIVEKYILFEELNGSQTHMGEFVNAPIIKGFSDDLQKFMDNQGLEHSKSAISFEVFKEREKDKTHDYLYSDIKANLRESDETSFLMYFARKAESQLNWIRNSTGSEILKSKIEFYKSIKITFRKIE
ncbi:MAG TPA: hypothetical protein DIW31_07480 [Bacteroidales bacterium]|nr:hypothetical protein [Bacteroidales bacterium]